MYYVAFYTDCERELSQVTSGCLLALVYNLRRAELTRKVGEKSGRGAGKEQPWDSGDVSMTKREAQDWEREWAAFCGSAGVCGTSTAVGMAQSTASSRVGALQPRRTEINHDILVRAKCHWGTVR